MEEYRAFIVGDDGHFMGFEPIICASDVEAVEKARDLAGYQPVELWSGARFVMRLEPDIGKSKRRSFE